MNKNDKGKAQRRLYRRRHAAELLDTSITMLKRLEAAGKLRVIRLGGRDVFYQAEQVEALAQGDTTE